MFKRLFLTASIAALAHAALSLENIPLKPEPHYDGIVKKFAQRFPREHLARSPIDDRVAQRAWTNYVTSFDYDRVYFLQEDIDRFGKSKLTIDDRLRDGDIAFAYEVFEVFKDRLRERCRFTEALLEEGFELDIDETYTWKRKDLPWPTDEAARDEIWRKRIKNEYVRRLVAKELAEAAKAKEAEKPPPSKEPDDEDALENEDEDLTPEAFILKRYKQQLTVIEDSDAEWVLQRYLTAFANAYDPHSNYMSPSSLEDFEIEMKLSLVGIGALLRAEDGAAKIVRIIPGGPADRDERESRLRPGDKIIAVAQDDGPTEDILHLPLTRIVRKIRGPKGSRVVLTVIPASDPSGNSTKLVDLIRDKVKLEEQAASGKIHTIEAPDDRTYKLGVVRVPAFYADMKAASRKEPGGKSSADDVAEILHSMKTNKVEGVVLDLRNNGGGSLIEAIRMTGLFISLGPTVQVREQFGVRALPDRDPRVAYGGPMVVLVNRLSASASEILAGALQDYGRAIVVGDSKTHGKGTVQSVLALSKESRELGAIKITTASYYRINGSSTQLKGVLSDIVVSSAWDMMETGEERLDNAMPWTRVPAARYRPVADMRYIISDLRHKSVKRRETDPRYETYGKLLDRIREMNESKVLPLNLDARKRLSETERELADMQDELALTSHADEDEEALQRDLVLSEATMILADFVALRDKLGPLPEVTEQEISGSAQILGEWLRSLL